MPRRRPERLRTVTQRHGRLARPWRLSGWEGLEARALLAADGFTGGAEIGVEPVDIAKPSGPDREPLKIVGGDTAAPGRWPWMASVQEFSHFCGAALVAPDAVLTAAHCVEGTASSDLRIILGRHDLDSEDGEVHEVSEIIVHPDYDPYSNDADLAVLLLKTASPHKAIPILKPTLSDLADPGQLATVTGWGVLQEGGFGSEHLQEVVVPIVSNDVANQPQAYGGRITPRMLAAGAPLGGKDSCQGDSGGPLMVSNSEDQTFLAGIVSWGDGCARPNKYGIYTRITSFASWIDDKISLNSAGTLNFRQPRYAVGETVELLLKDADLINQGSVSIAIQSESGDSEIVELQETMPGRFFGQIDLRNTEPVIDNGLLEMTGRGTLTASYVDDDHGEGSSAVVTDTARVVVDDHSNGPLDATEFFSPGTIQGEIELDGDQDWFQLEVSTDIIYQFDVHLSGSLNDSVLRVYDASGQIELASDDDSGPGSAASLIYRPAESGTILLRVTGYGSNVGSYELEASEFAPGIDDHGNDADTATPMAVGQMRAGVIEIARDVDWFAFDAEPGQIYRIQTTLDTLSDSILRLLDQDGERELSYSDDHEGLLSSHIVWAAHEPGTYFVEVAGYQSETGSYQLTIETNAIPPDDHGNVPATGTPIAIPSVTAGELENAGDSDWFQFVAERGLIYEFETRLVTLGDSILRLQNGLGTELAFNDDQPGGLTFASKITWKAPANDTYFLEVDGFSSKDTGEYELITRSNRPPDDDHGNEALHATMLEVPEQRPGQLEDENDVDWFRFEAMAGVLYTIHTKLEGLSDSVLRIIAPDGLTELAHNDDGQGIGFASLIRFEPQQSGSYFIEVSGFSGASGVYQVSIESPAGDANRDGKFDSSDLVQIFQRGFYESAEAGDAFWDDGDWNGDRRFSTADLVLAFRAGKYQNESPAAVDAVWAEF